MSKRLLTILLLISLFINAGIVGGMLMMGIFRHNHVIHHGLKDPARPALREDRERLPRFSDDPRTKALSDSFRLTKNELMQALAKDPVDEQAVKAIIDRSVVAQGKLEHALGLRLLEQRKTMDAKAAQEYFGRRLERRQEFQNRRKPQ